MARQPCKLLKYMAVELNPTQLYPEIGRAICDARRRREMSQQTLASSVGLSRASVANIERGVHRVQIHVLYSIASALEIEPHDLLPHQFTRASRPALPAEFSDELKPNEKVAIGRLLNTRRREGNNEAK